MEGIDPNEQRTPDEDIEDQLAHKSHRKKGCVIPVRCPILAEQ